MSVVVVGAGGWSGVGVGGAWVEVGGGAGSLPTVGVATVVVAAAVVVAAVVVDEP